MELSSFPLYFFLSNYLILETSELFCAPMSNYSVNLRGMPVAFCGDFLHVYKGRQGEVTLWETHVLVWFLARAYLFPICQLFKCLSD